MSAAQQKYGMVSPVHTPYCFRLVSPYLHYWSL